MTKELAKQKIKTLIERYNSLTPEEKRMNEETTKAKFIRPLFEVLGWNFEEDVLLEDKISHGRVDYNFRIDGRTKFYLEAKPLKADIDDLRYAKQAANYAWLKNVNWAVLTDFEGIKIFYPAEHGQAKACLRLDLKDYLASFDDLWILSKESFKNDLIDQQAAKWGAKPERVKVSEQLANDMNTWRQGLSKHFKTWNENINDKDLDEGVQKILDRFIFIRSCEDRGLENDSLRSRYRIWQEEGRKGNFLTHLKPIFAEYQKNYNSGLFDEHPCMDWEISSECFDEIIEGLYRSENGQDYNFSIIDADALGGVYEQYLGHLLQKSKSDGDISKKKRKAQGIYYTPVFIVEYIVQNTLGKILQEKSPQEIANLKILDPACGSGSFLIKTFDFLTNYYFMQRANKKFDLKTKIGKLQQAFQKRDGVEELSVTQKMDILRNNIYGVDLDQQAVEIAQLNLMLKTLERKQILPHLNNIKCGNSLIDDPKIAGDKSFNWSEQFPDIMKAGGFDIIIGNPPYLKEMDNKNIFEPIIKSDYKKYYQGKMDLWYFFLHRAIDLIKEGGIIGFITNSYFLKSDGASKLNERIKNELVLFKAVDFGNIKLFGDVSGRHMIHIYQKRKAQKSDKSVLINIPSADIVNFIDEKNKKEIPYLQLIEDNKINFETNKSIDFNKGVQLGKIFDVSQGTVEATGRVGSKNGDGVFVLNSKELESLKLTQPENNVIKKYLNTNDVGKYFIKPNHEFLIYSDKEIKQKITYGKYPNLKKHLDKMQKCITSSNKPYGLHRPRNKKYFEDPKLICKGMFLTPEFCYDDKKHYVGFSFSVIIQKDKNYSLKYLLALLNSSLGKYWFNINGKKRGIGVDIGVKVFRQLPVFCATNDQQKSLSNLVDEILSLNKKLQKVEKGTNRWNQIKSKISQTDEQIDRMVYRLYGLTPKEIKIIEESERCVEKKQAKT